MLQPKGGRALNVEAVSCRLILFLSYSSCSGHFFSWYLEIIFMKMHASWRVTLFWAGWPKFTILTYQKMPLDLPNKNMPFSALCHALFPARQNKVFEQVRACWPKFKIHPFQKIPLELPNKNMSWPALCHAPSLSDSQKRLIRFEQVGHNTKSDPTKRCPLRCQTKICHYLRGRGRLMANFCLANQGIFFGRVRIWFLANLLKPLLAV